MIDTSVPEEEEAVGPSRTDARKERKAMQARLERLAVRLAAVPLDQLPRFGLDEPAAKAIAELASTKRGSALARQRRRVAGLLRSMDLDALEAALDAVRRKPGRSPSR